MSIDPVRRAALAAIAALPLLSACEHDMAGIGGPASTFGEANRQTMMAQVVDPDPEYEFRDPDTSAQHAADAVERYRRDEVKQPDSIRSTETGGR
jgi:hypothetical protein